MRRSALRELKPNPAMTRGMKVERAPLQTFFVEEEEEVLENFHRWKIYRKEKENRGGEEERREFKGQHITIARHPIQKASQNFRSVNNSMTWSFFHLVFRTPELLVRSRATKMYLAR